MTRPARNLFLATLVLVTVNLGIALYVYQQSRSSGGPYKPRPRGTLTFSRHVAPIIFGHCSGCHRPGQAAPFALLTYEDVQKRARQIAEVVQSGYMPPWMPEPGHGDFAESRRLSTDESGMLLQWIAEGAAPGDLARVPAPPRWSQGWQLGEPDLVAAMPEPYTLRADGPDLYRNFVIPIPLAARRYVTAFEFDPGNQAIVHHAFIRFDRSRQSRRRDAEDPAPGFDGIHAPATAQPPEGYFLSWQPGKVPHRQPDGFSWPLAPNTDIVLQLHLQPSGKPESIQARIGFHLTDRPPAREPMKIWLSSYAIDIPAGQADYALEDSYTLPAPVEVLGILPHAHYLGKTMEAFATLPGGEKRPLLLIKHWDFNWQGDYRYARPVALPQGTKISMRFVYDNSTNNPVNPNHPPQRIRYGLQSTDEMGELWLQILPRDAAGRTAIARDYQQQVIKDTLAYNQYLLGLNPNDARAHTGLGKGLYFAGRLNEAAQRFQHALSLDPREDEAYYYLGLTFRRQDQLIEARQAFTAAAQLNPENARAFGNLGLLCLDLNELPQAEQYFRKTLQLDPEDLLAQDNLGVALARQGRLAEAQAAFEAALRLDPHNKDIQDRLRQVRQQNPRPIAQPKP